MPITVAAGEGGQSLASEHMHLAVPAGEGAAAELIQYLIGATRRDSAYQPCYLFGAAKGPVGRQVQHLLLRRRQLRLRRCVKWRA